MLTHELGASEEKCNYVHYIQSNVAAEILSVTVNLFEHNSNHLPLNHSTHSVFAIWCVLKILHHEHKHFATISLL